MEGDREDPVRVVEDVLHPVAVVGVDVHVEDPLRPVVQEPLDAHGDVVEEAEARRAGAGGVVEAAAGGEGLPARLRVLAGEERGGHMDGGALVHELEDRVVRGAQAVRGGRLAGPGGGEALHRVDVGRAVDREDLGVGGPLRRAPLLHPVAQEARHLHQVPGELDAHLAEGVAGAEVVLEEVVRVDQDGGGGHDRVGCGRGY